MYLLATDFHLDDQPTNEYRWGVFEHILTAVMQYDVKTVFILGDLVDRKDRFSAAFVNRLLVELSRIAARCPVYILRGNHDTTMHPPCYFDFLAEDVIENITYVTKPLVYAGQLLLLPFTATPKEDWAHIKLGEFKAVFMHATVTGAQVENGQIMESHNFPILPRYVRFYSGDVHVPQAVRNIVYVGCPHPIKFGDNFPCRMLLLNDEYEIVHEILLSPPRKHLIEISDIHELERVRVRPGDQIRIRFNYPADQVGNWGLAESCIDQWAQDHGVTIAGTEVIVETSAPGGDDRLSTEQAPEHILRAFAAHEELDDELLAVGLALLREVA